MLEALSDELVGYTGLSWDDAPDAFGSMRRASVLVSDLSGIVFDFAFVFGKPIAVVRFEYDETGMEASDLRGPLWEVDAVGKIGLSVDEAEIASLPQRVRELAGSQELRESIQAVKEQGLFHPGEAARTAARQILEIHKAVASDAAQNEG